jgi:hypothetical protein
MNITFGSLKMKQDANKKTINDVIAFSTDNLQQRTTTRTVERLTKIVTSITRSGHFYKSSVSQRSFYGNDISH